MTQTAIKVARKAVAAVVAATFPTYKGRKITVVPTDRVTFYDTVWGGGTRNSYAAVNLDTLQAGRLAVGSPMGAAFHAIEGNSFDMLPGVVVVEHAIFCGKDSGLRIFVHPSNVPPSLTEGGAR